MSRLELRRRNADGSSTSFFGALTHEGISRLPRVPMIGETFRYYGHDWAIVNVVHDIARATTILVLEDSRPTRNAEPAAAPAE